MRTVPVSVVIPCYRCAGTVARAVRSAAEQTSPPKEIILVDDASGDGTLQALESLRGELGAALVKIVALPLNGGPGSARNAGWAAAGQALIAFLDADDAWHPRKLELQGDFMDAHPEFELSGHLLASESRHRTIAHLPARSEDMGFMALGLNRLLFRNWLAASSVMVRREVEQRFEEGSRHAEDYSLWLRMAAAGHRLALLDAPLCVRFDPPFGGRGLSGAIWRMESAELQTYRELRRKGAIAPVLWAAASAWSLARFLRRAALVGLR